MKKPTAESCLRCRRLSVYRLRRDKRRRLFRLRRRRKLAQCGGRFVLLTAPECFSLSGRDAARLVEFVRKLRQVVLPGFGRVEIKFSHTEKMAADGTLYFLANLEQIRQLYPKVSFSMRPPSDAVAAQVLQHVGIARILGGHRPQKKPLHPSVRHWYKAAGNNVDASEAQDVFGSFEGRITPELSRSVYKGVSEAMTNCFHHAYADNTLPLHLCKWWLFSREDKGELHVVFCDLGIGIPRSLFREDEKVEKGWIEYLKTWLAERVSDWRQADDALKIKAAIEIGQTRTRKPNRGKGLKQMVGFLDAIGNNAAKVTIYSGSGVYRRMPKKGRPQEFTHALSDKKTAILGTMISWSIPLPEKDDTL